MRHSILVTILHYYTMRSPGQRSLIKINDLHRNTENHSRISALDLHVIVSLLADTRVYVHLTNDWKDKNLEGLCGNYNGNADDDYKSKSGAVESVSNVFADSWATTLCPTKQQEIPVEGNLCLVRTTFCHVSFTGQTHFVVQL